MVPLEWQTIKETDFLHVQLDNYGDSKQVKAPSSEEMRKKGSKKENVKEKETFLLSFNK